VVSSVWSRARPSLFRYTSSLNRIAVQTPSRPYEVLIERGLLGSTAATLRDMIAPGARVFALTSPPVRKHYGNLLRKSFAKSGHKFELLVMPDGERWKTLSQLEKLAAKMMRHGADRQSVLLALGGGVVGDVGAFLASIFMRGIPVVQIPTTLLAQVDSSVGGKTGVNLKAGKNLLGTFHQPLAVLADPDVLKTLPEREYRSGLFEAMKYGVIRNPAIFEMMESNSNALLRRDGAPLETLITECIRVKAEVVSADERGTPHPEFWPHHRPRAGGGDQLPAPAARRSRGLGHDRRRHDRRQHADHRHANGAAHPFPGPRLRAVAEAAGRQPERDEAAALRQEDGRRRPAFCFAHRHRQGRGGQQRTHAHRHPGDQRDQVFVESVAQVSW